jgi:hypothetical protein
MSLVFCSLIFEWTLLLRLMPYVMCMQAVQAARLEEHVQMLKYGLVEGAHDVDEADVTTRVGGCLLFLRILDADSAAVETTSEQIQIQKDVDKAIANLSSIKF